MFTKTVSWGEALIVQMHYTDGGLNKAISAIHSVVGARLVGTRNTFARLYRVTDPAAMKPIERFRAWLLLTALGVDPASWGIDDADVFQPFDAQELRSRLTNVGLTGFEPVTITV